MAKKVFGAFYNVDVKKDLDFDNIQAISLNLRKCAKAEFTLVYTNKKDEQGFFVGGHAEHHNEPQIVEVNSTGGVNLTVEQKDPRAEGLLRITLALPVGKKLVGFRSDGNVIEYNIIGVDIAHVNISNKKGHIKFKGRVDNLGLFSTYYPVEAEVELYQDSLIQVGSRTADVTLKLNNAGEVVIERQPNVVCTVDHTTIGKNNPATYQAKVYFPSQAEGKYTIIK